jgi:hypothetical protein
VRSRFRELRAKAARSERRAPQPSAPPPSSPDGEIQPPICEQVAEGPACVTAATRPAPPPVRPTSPSATEAQLVEALLGCPQLCAEAVERLPNGAVTHPLCRDLFDRLLARYEETGAPPPLDSILGAIEDPELASFAAGLRARGAGKDQLERQGRECIRLLAMHHEWRQMQAGMDLFAEPDAQGSQPSPEANDFLRQQIEFHRRRTVRR